MVDMHVSVITPADPVVTYAEAKAQCRIEADDEQGLITSLIAAATDKLSAPNGDTEKSLGSQTLEARFDVIDPVTSIIELPFGPVTSIVSIKYLDSAGVEQTLSSDVYQLLTDDRVALEYGQSWPTATDDPQAFRVQYVAGYETLPSGIKAAILLIVAFLYQNREASIEQVLNTGAVRSLITNHSVWSI